jgi:beta-galactosidase
VTVRRLGAGTAWYLATRPDAQGLRAVLDAVYAAAGLVPDRSGPAGLDVVDRHGAGGERFRFLLNNAAEDAPVTTAGGVELLAGERVPAGRHVVPAGAVHVLHLDADAPGSRLS